MQAPVTERGLPHTLISTRSTKHLLFTKSSNTPFISSNPFGSRSSAVSTSLLEKLMLGCIVISGRDQKIGFLARYVTKFACGMKWKWIWNPRLAGPSVRFLRAKHLLEVSILKPCKQDIGLHAEEKARSCEQPGVFVTWSVRTVTEERAVFQQPTQTTDRRTGSAICRYLLGADRKAVFCDNEAQVTSLSALTI